MSTGKSLELMNLSYPERMAWASYLIPFALCQRRISTPGILVRFKDENPVSGPCGIITRNCKRPAA